MESQELLQEILSVKYEVWEISRLIPYARNPRKNDHVVDKMAGQIKEFGMPIPICIRPDGSIVDGHLRYKAAKKLGLEQVPVAINHTWTPEKIQAFRISVNKTAEWAEWDNDFLSLEVQELKDQGYDLDYLGFEQEEIDKLINNFDLSENNPKEKNIKDVNEFIIVINCNNESEQKNLYEEIIERGYSCKLLM